MKWIMTPIRYAVGLLFMAFMWSLFGLAIALDWVGCKKPLRRFKIMIFGIDAQMEDDGQVSCICVPQEGFYVFFAGGEQQRAVLKKWINRIKNEISKPENAERFKNSIFRRYSRLGGGWMVSRDLHNALYEGVMHDEEHPQAIHNVSLGGFLPGVTIIDT